MIVLGIVAVALVLVFLWGMGTYNNLVKYRVQVTNSWSQIDVQLKRRHDLIPNLVETVKGVMQYEKQTLTQIVEARAMAVGATSMNERVKAENQLSGGIGRLLAVWENYPNLKANQNATLLQEELVSTENKISYSRSHFNDITANFNTLIAQFPTNVLAGAFGFKTQAFLDTPQEEKAVPKVNLG